MIPTGICRTRRLFPFHFPKFVLPAMCSHHSRSSSLSPPAPLAPAAPQGVTPAHAFAAAAASAKHNSNWLPHCPPPPSASNSAPGAPMSGEGGPSPVIFGRGLVAQRLASALGTALCSDHSLAAGREAICVLNCDRTAPVNQSVLDLLAAVNACKAASRVTAVLPYMPYSRQDKRPAPGAPVGARLLADMLTAAGVQRVVVLDAHVPQIDAFFNPLRVSFVQACAIEAAIVPRLRALVQGHPEAVVVTPDAGGLRRASVVAGALGLPLSVVCKARDVSGRVCCASVIGAVAGRPAIVIDDIADSCGTLLAAADALKRAGCTRIIAAAVVHGLFSTPDVGKALSSAGYEALVVTNTCGPCPDVAVDIHTIVLDAVPVIADALR